MISICIPVYNHNIHRLLTSLYEQCEILDSDYEIILIDDASDDEYKMRNRAAIKKINSANIKYEELKKNVGRATTRNLFVQKASYPYLIFIDSDAEIYTPDFVLKYIREREPGVICYGGCVYTDMHNKDESLRWIFGKNREAIPAEVRIKSPNRYFSTFNFLIDKRLLLLHPFNEKIKKYGYEDVLLKMELLNNGFSIKQIENPLIHTGLISNKEFIDRTRTALNNLYTMQKENPVLFSCAESVSLLKSFFKVEKLKLTATVSYLFRLMEKTFRKNLLSSNPSLFVFDLYKLGYFCNLKNIDK